MSCSSGSDQAVDGGKSLRQDLGSVQDTSAVGDEIAETEQVPRDLIGGAEVAVPDIGRDYISACCETDGDCPDSGQRCIREGLTGGSACLAAPSEGRCWTDKDCGEGLRCGGAWFTVCGALEQVQNQMGSCYEPAMAECMDNAVCPCMDGCVDGVGVTYYYPESEGEFRHDRENPYPQDEVKAQLEEVGLAMYECDVCNCRNEYRIKEDGQWTETGAEGLCTFVLARDEECDGCLTTW